MASRKSSGSMRAESAVEPTRSENIRPAALPRRSSDASSLHLREIHDGRVPLAISCRAFTVDAPGDRPVDKLWILAFEKHICNQLRP